jgi:Domain of unknown function (DUF5710)
MALIGQIGRKAPWQRTTAIENHRAKRLGARWENGAKTWFITKGRVLAPFQRGGLI